MGVLCFLHLFTNLISKEVRKPLPGKEARGQRHAEYWPHGPFLKASCLGQCLASNMASSHPGFQNKLGNELETRELHGSIQQPQNHPKIFQNSPRGSGTKHLQQLSHPFSTMFYCPHGITKHSLAPLCPARVA